MSASEPFVIEVWKGDWNLPSIDPECVAAITYFRLSDAPVELRVNNEPWRVPGKSYPIMTSPKWSSLPGVHIKLSGSANIIRTLISEGFQCPYEKDHMTPYEEADAYALDSYIRSSFGPLLDYIWWVDDEIFKRTTLPWYQKELSYYGQLTWMHRQRKRVRNRLLTSPIGQLSDARPENIRSKITEKARRCLEDLCVKLSEKTFLFGLKPAAVDAVAYGYLAPLFYIPWKNKEIRKEIFSDNMDKFKNLKLYIDRIRKRYFENGSPLTAQTICRPQFWYHRALESALKHQDIIVFLGLAAILNIYLLNRTFKRLRFRWPGLDNHARQKMQEYAELMKSIGLNAEPSSPP